MALLPTVGRRNWSIRFGIGLMYLVLSAGGISMIYPYLIMLTGAISNDYDFGRYAWYPRYLVVPHERYLKYLADRYADASRFEHFKAAYGTPDGWGGFGDLGQEDGVIEHFPLYGVEGDATRWPQVQQRAADYEAFLVERQASRASAEDLMPVNLEHRITDFQSHMRLRYATLAAGADGVEVAMITDERALRELALRRGEYYPSFYSISFTMYKNYGYELQKWIPTQATRHVDYVDWVRSLPPRDVMPVSRHYLWVRFLRAAGVDAATYSALSGMPIASITEARYPSEATDALRPVATPALAELRDRFLREAWPVRLRRLAAADEPRYRAQLREQFATLSVLNDMTRGDYAAWDAVPFPLELPSASNDAPATAINYDALNALGGAWRNAAVGIPLRPADMLCPERDYQAFLLARYGDLAAINAVQGTTHVDVSEIGLPIPEMDYLQYQAKSTGYFLGFMTFNYSRVLAYMTTKGRATVNTLVLVLLSITAVLTVNPLAAYALSRYRLKRTNQILIFLLATMAFPPEVAMIPSFLLLRDLQLLNSFAALILPSLANGFSIFLLKGFFDSLPAELYEAASIDGASEWRMFRTITLPLCKPILAVIALNTFIATYGAFMWAFLVCQDEKMWTIMVWLFRFQSTMKDFPHLVMASLVVASLPTLVVFVFCQRIILRGIIIPSMK